MEVYGLGFDQILGYFEGYALWGAYGGPNGSNLNGKEPLFLTARSKFLTLLFPKMVSRELMDSYTWKAQNSPTAWDSVRSSYS